MFSSNKRCNGNIAASKNMGHLSLGKKNNTNVKNLKNSFHEHVISNSFDEELEDSKNNSIIDLSEKAKVANFGVIKQNNEVIQRLNGVDQQQLEDVCNFYQKNWFSASLEKLKIEEKSREERIEITRHEFQRHLHQIVRSNLGQTNKMPGITSKNETLPNSVHQPGYDRLVAPKVCSLDSCNRPALPCTKHCTLHIMCNPEQVLFGYCTAKFADNTQCSVPVFDITHELPLCPEHARKRDNYKLYQEAKPKKLRKKVKPSAMIRPQKRNKKKRKPVVKLETPVVEVCSSPVPVIVEGIVQETIETESPELVEDMHIVDQVLGLNEELTAQASHILEETDINSVLSTIHVDEFSDFFSVTRNGEFEQPSREEAEELEKALAAVDNDVKSLEKLTQTHGGLLDSFLDEQLVPLPDVFHNGYTVTCGDSMVTQNPSFLLPVVPHSNS